ncbi:hypothetical protein [Polaromonas sp. YR568]|uniref:hypothetical protein n=1 Tax=Polaromonas sp. YR568 TaxID=1855301 RepID=UPI0031378241
MGRFTILQSVKAKPTHPRGGDEHGNGGEAGHVSLIDPDDNEKVGVTWDTDGKTEAVKVSDLIAL